MRPMSDRRRLAGADKGAAMSDRTAPDPPLQQGPGKRARSSEHPKLCALPVSKRWCSVQWLMLYACLQVQNRARRSLPSTRQPARSSPVLWMQLSPMPSQVCTCICAGNASLRTGLPQTKAWPLGADAIQKFLTDSHREALTTAGRWGSCTACTGSGKKVSLLWLESASGVCMHRLLKENEQQRGGCKE